MSEREIRQLNHRHLPADVQRGAGPPGAQRLRLASRAVGVVQTARQEYADGGNTCRRVESRVLGAGITHPASHSPFAFLRHGCTGPDSSGTSEQGMLLLELPGTNIPSLAPCFLLLLPLADEVSGVGIQVNGDVWSPGMMLAWVLGEPGL